MMVHGLQAGGSMIQEVSMMLPTLELLDKRPPLSEESEAH